MMIRRPGRRPKIAFLWENLGPMHVARLEAVSLRLGADFDVVAVEMFDNSSTYQWEREGDRGFERTTVAAGSEDRVWPYRAFKIAKALVRDRPSHVFFCHYQKPEVLVSSVVARLFGMQVYIMAISKFDDYQRSVAREFLKSFWVRHYQGAISTRGRSVDYLRFQGMSPEVIVTPYNTVETRIFRVSHERSYPDPSAPFIVVSRLVVKKNIDLAIRAYDEYRSKGGRRLLRIVGYGELDTLLKDLVAGLNLTAFVEFTGGLETSEVANEMKNAFALLLPSSEEQFGNVLLEAQAAGLPSLVTDAVGARDSVMRSAVDGFVIEPDNPVGLAFFMTLLDNDRQLWERISSNVLASSARGDVGRFAEAVGSLLQPSGGCDRRRRSAQTQDTLRHRNG